MLPDAHDPEARRERSIDAAIRALQPSYNSRHEPGTGMLLDAADRIAYLDADLAADLRRLASDYRAAVSGLRQRIEELA